MEEFLKTSGAYSYVVVAIISFFLGIVSSLFVESFKRRIEKDKLIDLFVADIRANWFKLEELRGAPVEPYWGRLRVYFKGFGDLKFTGQPEYEFEVHNLKFFEAEGFKLVQTLGSKTRKEFWEVYSLIRDAEAVRKVIKSLPEGHKDRPSYKNLFTEIMNKLAPMFAKLAKTLNAERSWYRRLIPWR
jgi:hypothetical protein